jgi:hypothetical protein
MAPVAMIQSRRRTDGSGVINTNKIPWGMSKKHAQGRRKLRVGWIRF